MDSKSDHRGYTLVELVVVMAVFVTIVMISTNAFENIMFRSSQQTKAAETQIQGVVGLELLRGDLERAGFGLPWSFQSTTPALAYQEAAFTNVTTASLFNDAPGNPPRAVLSGPSTFNGGSDYLALKSTLVGEGGTSRKWTIVSYDAGGKTQKVWGSADRDFASTERVIVVKNSLISTPPSRELMALGSTDFTTTFGNYTTFTTPHLNGDNFQLYGISSGTAPRMPFNRVDYYVKRPDRMPKSCAPGTGILYRSIVQQSNGAQSAGSPLLNCVADLQVVYGLDSSNSGFVNSHSSTPPATAEAMRSQLKEIRVYVLAHEGKKDRFYSYPSTTIDVGESFDGGSTVSGRSFDLAGIIGPDYKHYRWKVYTIVVRPKNLIQ